MQTFKHAILFSSLIALTGCLEVEDDSNRGVEAALAQQNALLQEQNAQIGVIELAGTVVDTSDKPVAAGKASYKIGETWSEAIDLVEGRFIFKDLPSNSDVVIKIFSDEDAFAQSFVLAATAYSDTDTAYQELGRFVVSAPKTVEFSVVDEETGANISGLEFISETYVVWESSERARYSVGKEYANISSYDATKNTYSLTVPSHLADKSVKTNGDIDGDNQRDFTFNTDTLTADKLDNAIVFAHSIVATAQSVSFQIVNFEGKLIEGASLMHKLDGIGYKPDSISEAGVMTFDDLSENYNINFDMTLPSAKDSCHLEFVYGDNTVINQEGKEETVTSYKLKNHYSSENVCTVVQENVMPENGIIQITIGE